MLMDLSILVEYVKAVAPIDGVTIGDINDTTTWSAQFADEATDDEKDAARVVLDAFDKDLLAMSYRISKLTLLARLDTAGLFDAAHTALTATPLLYQRWLASKTVDPTDQDVLNLLNFIQADLNVMLAPE